MALWTPADAASFTDEQWWEAWDAATLTLTGSAVDQWNDKSGNARHASQGTAAAKPTYSATSFDGGPGLTCDGGDRLNLTTTVPVVQSFSTDTDINNISGIPIGSTDFPGIENTSSITGLLAAAHIAVSYWDGSAWHMRVNGASVGTGGWTDAPTAPGVYWHAMDLTTAGNFGFGRWATKDGTAGNTLCLFNRGNDLARGLEGVCAAIGMGSAASLPDIADIEKLEGYLAWGAGIDSVLPIGHPYKSAAPQTGSSVAPAAGSLAYTGYAPTLTTISSVAPAAGALTYTGYAPTVGNATSIAPGAGSLAYTGYAPTLSTASNVAPGADTLAFTGYAPSLVNSGSAVTPAKGSLVYTGYAPTLLPVQYDTQLIPVVNNLEQLRKRANVILETLQAYLPGYGDVLPDVADQPDGRLFTDTTTQTLYQVQAGAWVAVDMVP